MKIAIIYNPKAIKTVRIIKNILVNNYDITTNIFKYPLSMITLHSLDTNGYTKLYYGIDKLKLSKKDTLIKLQDIISNTLYHSIPSDYDTVIIKNPLRIMLYKDIPINERNNPLYRFISNKLEWRINCSFGKVNNVLRKDLQGNVFGKQHNCEWIIEEDEFFRHELIAFSKKILNALELQNCGIDIIFDNKDGEFYLLEVNQANGLGEVGASYFVNNYLKNIGFLNIE